MILGTGNMVMDPQFVGPFSQIESSFMRNVYLLAEEGFRSTYVLDEKARYTLASIVLYLASCERQQQSLESCDSEALATEALDVFLSMPIERMLIGSGSISAHN